MFLLLPAHLGCPGQNPESRKTVVYVCVCGRGADCGLLMIMSVCWYVCMQAYPRNCMSELLCLLPVAMAHFSTYAGSIHRSLDMRFLMQMPSVL